jgi:hypothetical protein
MVTLEEWREEMKEKITKQGVIERSLRSKGAFGYNWWYLIRHPWVIIREAWTEIKLAWQRAVRGWDERQTWNIDYEYSKILGELILRFKEVNNGVPNSILEQTTEDYFPFKDQTPEEFQASCELWDNVLEEMAEGFLYYHNHEFDYDYDDVTEYEKLLNEKINRSLELFSKHFRDLWW